MPTISVALCTFQGAAFVGEQVTSILAQTRPVTQLVVADDGSSDGTLDAVSQAVRAYREQHATAVVPAVTVLPAGDRLGIAGNFERALRACTGELIALSDQDDVWHPDRIAAAIAVLASSPGAGLVHSDARLVDAAGADLGVSLFEAIGLDAPGIRRINEGEAFELLLRRNHVTGATVLLTATLRDRALPVPPGWIHDEWLAIVAAGVSRTSVIDAPLIDYRQHGGNQIGASMLSTRDRFARLRQPREERNRRLLVRAESLAERLPALGIPAGRAAAVRRKLAHEQRRSALSRARLLRLGPVIAGALRGDYRRFGNGMQDVLRDLVQPA